MSVISRCHLRYGVSRHSLHAHPERVEEVNKEIAEFGCGVLQQPLRQTIVKASLMQAERQR
jgi:hypothetical protein